MSKLVGEAQNVVGLPITRLCEELDGERLAGDESPPTCDAEDASDESDGEGDEDDEVTSEPPPHTYHRKRGGGRRLLEGGRGAARRLLEACGDGGAEAVVRCERKKAALQDLWLAASRRRFECWWLGLPIPTQTQLGGCLGALGLHLASRLDSMLGGGGGVGAVHTPGCEWIGKHNGATSLEMPSFPSPPLEFELWAPGGGPGGGGGGGLPGWIPALPGRTLLPNALRLQLLSQVATPVGTGTAAMSWERLATAEPPLEASGIVSIVGAGAAAGFGASLLLGGLVILRGRHARSSAPSGSRVSVRHV